MENPMLGSVTYKIKKSGSNETKSNQSNQNARIKQCHRLDWYHKALLETLLESKIRSKYYYKNMISFSYNIEEFKTMKEK